MVHVMCGEFVSRDRVFPVRSMDVSCPFVAAPASSSEASAFGNVFAGEGNVSQAWEM